MEGLHEDLTLWAGADGILHKMHNAICAKVHIIKKDSRIECKYKGKYTKLDEKEK